MKASVLLGAGWEDDSLEVLWRDADRAFCRLRRNDVESARVHTRSLPAPSIRRSRASIASPTNTNSRMTWTGAWALRPLEFVRERGQTMLVVDYAGGEPLDRLVGQPMEIGRFLRLAVAPRPAHSVSFTDAGSFTRTSSRPTCSWTPQPGGSSLPASASPRDSRASASRRHLPSSSRERSPTWRPSRRDA